MDFIEFLNKIKLHEEVKIKVLKLIENKKQEFLAFINDLNNVNLSLETFTKIEECYSSDKENLSILSVYLLAALKTFEKYQEKGIDEDIFIDTMKCFTRFISECEIKTGKLYFDRGFWTYRQTNMSLFRIGVLEYEFLDDNKVSIHIPSDSVLTKDNIDDSFNKLTEFIKCFYPNYINSTIYCDSWLLSQQLTKYLPEGSRILLFQSYFEIIKEDLDALDFYEWVFKCDKNTAIVDLKEETSLQKKLKVALLNGKKIGKALGILKKK